MSCKIEDIVNNDLCVGCGLCISESKTSKMHWNEQGFLVPILDQSFSENAIKVCPSNPSPDSEVKDEDVLSSAIFANTTNTDFRIGRYEDVYVGYSNEYRETSSSGGIATFIFEQLLKRDIVNHLFVVKEIEGTYKYQWFDNAKQIKEISKTRYIPVTLEDLFKEIDSKEGKVAVSGVACFLKAIRLKQHYSPMYKEKIPFLVGIICGGLKSRFFTDYLAQKSGLNSQYKGQEYRIKDRNSVALDYSFGAYDNENILHTVKMKAVGDMWGTGYFKAHACDFCTDVAGELADISLGDAWIDPYKKAGLGNSVVVTRSNLAERLVKEGVTSGMLTLDKLSLEQFKLSQSGSFNHRQISVKFRSKYFKRKNGLIPNIRSKFFNKIPFEFKRVQKMRIVLRNSSIHIWRKYKNSRLFEENIAEEYSILRKRTIFYHRVQKIKGLLGLRKMKI